MRHARALLLLILISALAVPARADLSQPTRRERMQQSQIPRDRVSSVRVDYAAIEAKFIAKDHFTVDRLADEYLKPGVPHPQGDDALYLQAMSLKQLKHGPASRDKLKALERQAASKEVKASASSSVADSFYEEGDRLSAWNAYKETLARYPDSEQTAYALARLAELGRANGHGQEADGYRDRLLREYPGTEEARDLRARFGGTAGAPAARASAPPQTSADRGGVFAVQVGSFSKSANAKALAEKLKGRGYDAYVVRREWGTMFRVRVGNVRTREEVLALEARLQKDGYPTKIYP